jgi:hypothetical protein
VGEGGERNCQNCQDCQKSPEVETNKNRRHRRNREKENLTAETRRRGEDGGEQEEFPRISADDRGSKKAKELPLINTGLHGSKKKAIEQEWRKSWTKQQMGMGIRWRRKR